MVCVNSRRHECARRAAIASAAWKSTAWLTSFIGTSQNSEIRAAKMKAVRTSLAHLPVNQIEGSVKWRLGVGGAWQLAWRDVISTTYSRHSLAMALSTSWRTDAWLAASESYRAHDWRVVVRHRRNIHQSLEESVIASTFNIRQASSAQRNADTLLTAADASSVKPNAY